METTFRDPVCGMDVTPATAGASSEYEGEPYYFCCPGCKKTFEREPEKYVSKEHPHLEHAHHH
jgi:YHS domain-containing protein